MKHLKSFSNYSEGKNFIPPLPGGGMDEEGGKQYEEEQKKKSKSQIKKESDKASNFTKSKKGRKPIKTKK